MRSPSGGNREDRPPCRRVRQGGRGRDGISAVVVLGGGRCGLLRGRARGGSARSPSTCGGRSIVSGSGRGGPGARRGTAPSFKGSDPCHRAASQIAQGS